MVPGTPFSDTVTVIVWEFGVAESSTSIYHMLHQVSYIHMCTKLQTCFESLLICFDLIIRHSVNTRDYSTVSYIFIHAHVGNIISNM